MKKIISFILSFVMVVGIITSVPVTVKATSGSNYTSSSALAAKLDEIFSGDIDIYSNSACTTEVSMPVGTSMSTSTRYWVKSNTTGNTISGWQCYIYANAVYNKLFNEWVGHGGSFSHSENVITTGKSSVSYSDFVNAGVHTGAYIRTTNNSSGAYSSENSHSMIVLSYDSSNITYLEGNGDGYGAVRITTKTWSAFNTSQLSGKSRYISHVVQPTESYYQSLYPTTPQTYTPPQIVKSASTVDLKLGETESASVDVSFQNGAYPNACELGWKINNSSIAITNGGVVVASTYGSGTIFIDAIGIGTTSIDVYITDKVTGQIIATDYITVNVSAKTCNILYNANGGSGTMSGSAVNYLSEFSLKPNTFTKIGYTFVGWNAYRNSDGKWFVEGPGWQTDEEIASNSYTKKVYQDSVAMTFNDSWFAQLDSIDATDTFTFYAVWQPNHICVYMGTVTKPATCTENGIETFICSCGDSYTQEISATGHSYSSEWIVDLEPTCTEEGSKSKTCSVCQNVTTETLETLGHDYSTDWIIDKAASCTETGSKSHHCSRCESTIDITVIEATGHTESDWILDEEATNSTICSQHKECIICGEIVETQIIGVSHTVSSWQTTIEATVYSAGEKVGECTGCGATVVEEIPQLKCSKPTLETIRNATSGVRIVWNKVKGADSYNVYRRTKNGSYRMIGTTENSYFTDTSAVSGKRYYYSVKAVNEAGTSAYSSADSIYYLATPTLTKICNATGGLKITWSKISGAEGYYLYRKLYGTESWTRIATIKDSSTVSYKDTKVSEGKVYVYTVKAFDGRRKSSIDSDGIWLRYLKKPTLKTISNTGNGVKITWDEITRAEKYNVYRRVSNSEYEYIGSTTNTYYTDKTAKSGKKYYYTIRAQKGETVSYVSNALSKYYLEDPTLNTPSSTKSGIKLSWSEVTGAQGYIIYRKTGSGSYTKLKTEKGVTNLSYIDASAKKGTKYTYKVKAYYSKTYSAYSNTKTITDKY